MIEKIINLLLGKNIAILGFGREGKSTYTLLRKYIPDINLTIIDKDDMSNDELVKGDNLVRFVYGDTYLNELDKYDLIIKSPGITLKDLDVSSLKITSQLELLLEVARDRVIGVTGTKGKTTTTLLIYQILQANGVDVVVAGNMGVPIFDILDDIHNDTYIVIEMSSHQLEYIDVSPHIGVVLNLFQDHLDHTGGVEQYYKAKMKMFKYQTVNDYMVYCQDNENLNKMIKQSNFRGIKCPVDMSKEAMVYLRDGAVYYQDVFAFDAKIKINLKGKHNLENIMVAYMVSKILGLDDEKTLKTIQEFKPIPYRLESIGVVDGVEYYVDTLATIPEATINAIKAIDNINTLIFGGMDRGISYEGFAEFLKNTKIEHFICMPETGYSIAKELPKDRVYLAETLEEACRIAKEVTNKNTVCILSPAAASYSHFKNYAEKGDKFKELIKGKID